MNERPQDRPERRDEQEIDAEFARILSDQGMRLRPGAAPREPAAPQRRDRDGEGSPSSPDSPSPAATEEGRDRSRAAHPSFQRFRPESPSAREHAEPDQDNDEDDDEAGDEDGDEELPGDFVPPSPDIEAPGRRMLWSWTALVGGILLLLATAVLAVVPSWFGAFGLAASVGGLVSLLLRVPQQQRAEGDDGAEV